MNSRPSLVLDTMVARGFGQGDVDPQPFRAIRREGVRIHLSDGAVIELMSQLETNRLEWATWLKARRALRHILDPDDPVLLGGREGLAWRARVSDAEGTRDQEASEQYRATTRAIWRVILGASSLQDMRRPRTVKIKGRPSRTALDTKAATAAVTEMRAEWADAFGRLFEEALAAVPDVQKILPARGDSLEAINQLVVDMATRIDRDCPVDEPPPMSERLDAMIRVYMLHSLRRLRRKDPYNAEKHANDVFDHDLLRYLGYPAAICTRDSGIHADLRAAGSVHRQWVLTPEAIAGDSAVAALRSVQF
jgi:hypothetical protein